MKNRGFVHVVKLDDLDIFEDNKKSPELDAIISKKGKEFVEYFKGLIDGDGIFKDIDIIDESLIRDSLVLNVDAEFKNIALSISKTALLKNILKLCPDEDFLTMKFDDDFTFKSNRIRNEDFSDQLFLRTFGLEAYNQYELKDTKLYDLYSKYRSVFRKEAKERYSKYKEEVQPIKRWRFPFTLFLTAVIIQLNTFGERIDDIVDYVDHMGDIDLMNISGVDARKVQLYAANLVMDTIAEEKGTLPEGYYKSRKRGVGKYIRRIKEEGNTDFFCMVDGELVTFDLLSDRYDDLGVFYVFSKEYARNHPPQKEKK